MNISMLLDMVAAAHPDRVVVGSRVEGLTASDLRERALVQALSIRTSGADSLLFLDVNGPAFPVAMFAAARAGVPLIPLNYRLGREQIDELISRHPKAIGIAGVDHLETFRAAGLEVVSSADFLDVPASTVPAEEIALEDSEVPALVIYTSGTTSTPKGVLLRHANLVSYVLETVEFGSADPAEASLMSVPPYHIAAVANVLTNLYAGRRTLVLERFSPGAWLDLVRGERITNAMVVPTMLSRLIEWDGDKTVPTLRGLAYGGAPMPSSVIQQALETWPDVGFVNAYGLTETSSTVAVLTPEDHRSAAASQDPAVRARLGSTGRPVPGIEISIRGERDDVLSPGSVGRILVRGAQVSAEYAGIGRAVDAEGFFDTKDRGFLDSDGYLFIGGRSDDTIIRGAENVAPAEIEDILLRHRAVLDAAVVGVPDLEWGQRIEAAVVFRPGENVDEDQLRGFVRNALRASKTPDRIVSWDELPRTETGKLLRRDVLKRLLHDS